MIDMCVFYCLTLAVERCSAVLIEQAPQQVGVSRSPVNKLNIHMIICLKIRQPQLCQRLLPRTDSLSEHVADSYVACVLRIPPFPSLDEK